MQTGKQTIQSNALSKTIKITILIFYGIFITACQHQENPPADEMAHHQQMMDMDDKDEYDEPSTKNHHHRNLGLLTSSLYDDHTKDDDNLDTSNNQAPKAATPNPLTNTEPPAPMVSDIPLDTLDAILIGDYAGILPTLHGSERRVILHLYADGTVEKLSFGVALDDTRFVTDKGTYQQRGDIIYVQYDTQPAEQYHIFDNQLILHQTRHSTTANTNAPLDSTASDEYSGHQDKYVLFRQ